MPACDVDTNMPCAPGIADVRAMASPLTRDLMSPDHHDERSITRTTTPLSERLRRRSARIVGAFSARRCCDALCCRWRAARVVPPGAVMAQRKDAMSARANTV